MTIAINQPLVTEVHPLKGLKGAAEAAGQERRGWVRLVFIDN